MSKIEDSSKLTGFYGFIEWAGNKIPHPVYLFIWLWIITMVASPILAKMGVSVTHPTTNKVIGVVNLVTAGSIGAFLQNMGNKWMTFAPMLTVPICTLGLAVANHGGLLKASLKTASSSQSVWKLTLAVSFIGVNANLVGDAAFIVFPPLVAILFQSVKRNPLAGLFLAFASVSVGFGANVLVGSADASLAGMTDAAAKIVDPNYVANPAMGWYFFFVSTFFLTYVCAFISIKYIEPRLAKTGLGENSTKQIEGDEYEELKPEERKALKAALIALLVFFVAVFAMTLPGMPFQAPEGGTVMTGLLFRSIPTLVFLMFFVTGYVYGKVAGNIKKFGDTIPMMQKELMTLGSFFLVCFFAAQFIAVFGDSQIAAVIAIHGGLFLQSLGLPGPVLLGAFVVMVAFINLFMGSANGKWALLSAVFVPMFMIAGINPAATQVAYRMGDGLTNNITPTLPYLAIILGYAQEYDVRAKTGTVMAYMLPYSLIAGAVWIVFLLLWTYVGLPMGPGYGAFM
ncbi:MAG: AbgT family transporter [Synergistaceae bacterium]|jgi:aminobenzoyl-glutamate transport protein|nr:AbgT family transporter [Synergistaceae bacterium]